jgi:hypothetical protein
MGFINSTHPVETTKKLNFIFEAHEGNRIFVYETKIIVPGEELKSCLLITTNHFSSTSKC